MRTMITGLASAALLLAIASPSAAQRDHYYPRDNSPSSTAERQRHVRTFDPTATPSTPPSTPGTSSVPGNPSDTQKKLDPKQ